MSDAPREPLEPDLIRRPDDILVAGSPVFRTDDQRFVPPAPPPRPPKRTLALVLFLLTCVSTFHAGAEQFGRERYRAVDSTGRPVIVEVTVLRKYILSGLTYAGGVMLILGCHEMGHYLQARRYRVPARGPFFIPMPIGPIGTMGAVIVQQAGVADRKSLFDIAISGPIAGMVVALPMAWWGIQNSRIATAQPGEIMQGFGDPLLLKWIVRYHFGPLHPNQDVLINPVLLAGWVGVFITALNLFPIGQLDGGHILYCLLRRKAHLVARGLYLAAIAIVIGSALSGRYEYTGWILMLTLIGLMGAAHPPTADDNVPLGPTRTVAGWLALLFVFIGFTPTPFYQVRAKRPDSAPVQQPAPIERDRNEGIRV
jgi:Zn-dependent protease